MPQGPDAERIRSNAAAYADAYLRGYKRAMEVRFKEAGLSLKQGQEFLPMLALALGPDFSVSMLCEPTGTWIVFARIPDGRNVTSTNTEEFNRDWELYTPHPVRRRRVLELLGIPDEAVLALENVSSRGWLCDEREHFIETSAESHGIGRAEQDFPRALRRIRERESHSRWQEVASQVGAAMMAAGMQKAGYDFQDGLRRTLELAGCEPREVTIVGQQIDASCWIEGHPVFVEMLNSSAPAEAQEVRDILGKLTGRPASVIGILVAPGGFTKGAQEEAARQANMRTILLWGKEEVEQILTAPDRIKGLFLERYRDFIDKAGKQA